MFTKIIKSQYGHDVAVASSITKTRDNLHVIELSAKCGGTIQKKRVTIGGIDGPRLKPPSKELLQQRLDTHRTVVADDASWKETVRENMQGVE